MGCFFALGGKWTAFANAELHACIGAISPYGLDLEQVGLPTLINFSQYSLGQDNGSCNTATSTGHRRSPPLP